jgi:3-oxoacyl-[acyl-carrier protein] reductase
MKSTIFGAMTVNDLKLNGRTAMVCGSTQGIGFAAAHDLAQMGARVVCVARNEERLKEAIAALPGSGHSYLVADFAHPDQLAAALKTFTEGGGEAHILVNNTGGPPAGTAIDAEVDAFRIAFNQHLVCNHVLVQHLVPGMKRANYGRIINVISTSVKQPLPNLGVSNTIRGAVANWSKTLARELGPFGITVNNVLPGATDTARLNAIIERKSNQTGHSNDAVRNEMASEVPLGRIGKPEEIGHAIAFLASPAAAYISGINLPVDGGRTACL